MLLTFYVEFLKKSFLLLLFIHTQALAVLSVMNIKHGTSPFSVAYDIIIVKLILSGPSVKCLKRALENT